MAIKIKFVFFYIAILEIFSTFDFLPFQYLTNFTKPMLMPALALYFYMQTQNIKNTKKAILFTALFFAWWGDVFLMFAAKNSIYFMLGLGSFLVMQLLYSYFFRPFYYKNLVKNFKYSLPILIFGIIVLLFILPSLSDLKIPVFLYFSAIVLMVLAALSQWKRLDSKSSQIVFWGALLFMVSDSIIAINKFYSPFKLSEFLIMATYIIAQWLIVEGVTGILLNKTTV
jgi:uncharacterized membrane protein YhhN